VCTARQHASKEAASNVANPSSTQKWREKNSYFYSCQYDLLSPIQHSDWKFILMYFKIHVAFCNVAYFISLCWTDYSQITLSPCRMPYSSSGSGVAFLGHECFQLWFQLLTAGVHLWTAVEHSC
jgi:hypothetical protein